MGMVEYKVGVTGINGRMGQVIAQGLLARQERSLLMFGGGSARNVAAGVADPAYPILSPDDLFAQCDCVIDFTKPEALEMHLNLAVKHKTALVIGTTGMNAAQDAQIQDAAKSVAIVYAANMSIGVNLMLAVVQKVAAVLDDEFDIEIFEAHHKHKIDSPSGTALAVGKAAAKGRGVDFEAKALSNMGKRDGARNKGDIGFSVLRGGDIIGEHSAGFYGENERFEIKHMATNRSLFSTGAIKAATWLNGKDNGLYDMQDVLNLK